MTKSIVVGIQGENPKKKKSVLKRELYASEIRYRRLFESAKDGILILDAETGKIVDVNPFLIDLLGYSKDEFIEKSIWEIGAFQDIIENKDKFLELQQSEYVRYEELPLETSNGRKIHVEFVSNVYLVNDKKVIQCQIRDITEKKEAEAILEKTRIELAEIKEAADEFSLFTENIIDTIREPLLAIDKDLRIIKASRSFYHFFKVTAEETIGKLIYELGNHQWDIPKLKELLEEIIPKKNTFDNYEVEHNFSTIGKRVMLLNARQVKRAFGKEKIILLAIEDITERKGKEDTLKETHRATSEFLNILLNHLHAPIIVWDTSMIIKRFNRKFELLSGYDAAEVIDKKLDFLFPKEKIASTLELLKNHLDDEHLEVVEIDILTKDNNIKTVLWNSSRILDEEGKNIIATISQDITSRKRTEDALNLLETRYRRLFESAKDGILILNAENGKIVDVNPFLIDLLGYTKKDFTEKSIWELRTFQDIYENKEKFLELQQEEYVRYDDLPLVTSDGRTIHVEFISNVYLANNIKVIQCNIRDISENWQIKKQIVESEKQFRTITENSADAIFISDKEGKYIYVNKQAVDLLGYSKEELLTFTLADVSPKNRIEEYFQIFKHLLLTGSSYSEIELVRKDGSNADTDLNAVLLPNGWVYGSCRDISERKRAEIELIEAKERAEESERLKSAFLANMSHEIRTPMNGILGFTELLKDHGLSGDDQQEYIKIIEKSGARMLNIINDIIAISTIESHQIENKLSETNVNEQVAYIYNFFKLEAVQKKLHISYKNGLPNKEAIIVTDREKVYAVLTNLVKNAIKFTQTGSIELGYLKKEGFFEFYVKDSGSGVSPEQKDIIFERFRQGSESLARNYEGAGLGLSISKAYVEMLGGRIWVENNAGENGAASGATFFFAIPAHPVKKTIHVPQVASLDHSTKNETRKLKILIVEDDKTSKTLIIEMVKVFAREFLKAASGVEAIEICRKNPDIDLVLMDINMPEMDGYEATRQIREFNKDVVIIAQTAYALTGDREKSIAAGCNSYITKPINRVDLGIMIKNYFTELTKA
jgi:PAS domain S-box-containing protein